MLEYFYFGIIKNVISGFGTLFNDIYISKYDNNNSEIKRIKVPFSYAPKQKFLVRKNQSEENLIRNTEVSLPRIGFEINSLIYDSVRKLSTTQMTIFQTPENGSSSYQLEKVPYNLNISVHILTKNTEDNLQIIEQILPYFGPDFCITFKSFGLDSTIDVPISIGNISMNENYEGNFDEERKVFVTTIQFVAKLFLYGPIKKSKVITQTDANFIDFESMFVTGYTSNYGIETPVWGATGSTFANVRLTVTAGTTAGSLGVTGNIIKTITEYPLE